MSCSGMLESPTASGEGQQGLPASRTGADGSQMQAVWGGACPVRASFQGLACSPELCEYALIEYVINLLEHHA